MWRAGFQNVMFWDMRSQIWHLRASLVVGKLTPAHGCFLLCSETPSAHVSTISKFNDE